MVKLDTPKGENCVAHGAKPTKAKKKEGLALHKAGTHGESDYAELGKSATQRKSLKPHMQN